MERYSPPVESRPAVRLKGVALVQLAGLTGLVASMKSSLFLSVIVFPRPGMSLIGTMFRIIETSGRLVTPGICEEEVPLGGVALVDEIMLDGGVEVIEPRVVSEEVVVVVDAWAEKASMQAVATALTTWCDGPIVSMSPIEASFTQKPCVECIYPC